LKGCELGAGGGGVKIGGIIIHCATCKANYYILNKELYNVNVKEITMFAARNSNFTLPYSISLLPGVYICQTHISRKQRYVYHTAMISSVY